MCPIIAAPNGLFLRGALATVDRNYGILNQWFHHIGDTHVCHHIFSKMPHYHSEEATKYLKPILGKYYKYDDTPIFEALWQTRRFCKYVDDQGEILKFKNDLKGNNLKFHAPDLGILKATSFPTEQYW